MEKKYDVGSTIFSLKPFVHCLLNDFKGSLCDYCFKASKLLKCSSCKMMHYCNSTCQRSDWSMHKVECQKFAQVKPEIIADDQIRLYIRVLIKLKNTEGDYSDSYGIKTFNSLMDHYEDIVKDSGRLQQMNKCLQVIKTLMNEEFLQEFQTSQLISLFGKIVTNTFMISREDLSESIGSAIYLSASTLDHSCTPNCVAIFDGTELNIKAIEKISSLKKAYISYVDLLNATNERQEALKKQYYFNCECNKCKDKTLDDKMLSIYCKHCKKPLLTLKQLQEKYEEDEEMTTIIDYKCDNCSKLTKKIHINDINNNIYLLKQVKQENTTIDLIKKKLTLFFCVDNDDIEVDVLKNIDYCYLENIYIIKLLELLADLYIKCEDFSNAVKILLNLVYSYNLYLPKNHPLIGINYFKIAKIELYLQHYENAEVNFIKAEHVIQITHGRNHGLYGNLMELMQQCYFEKQQQQQQQKHSLAE